jgi:hypothetical protein
MPEPLMLAADAIRIEAIAAADELLMKLQIEHAFVGEAAKAAWLGATFDSGSVDVLALLAPERKPQIPMMASNRGFEVNREAVEAADELDLVPLGIRRGENFVRVHVLVASNALYAQMVNGAVEAQCGERTIRVAAAEDLALMLTVGDSEESDFLVRRVIEAAGERFDRDRYNERLTSIGLRGRIIR